MRNNVWKQKASSIRALFVTQHWLYTSRISVINFKEWPHHSHKPKPYFLKYRDWLWTEFQRGRSSSSARRKIFLFATFSRPLLGPSQSNKNNGYLGIFPGAHRLEREADHPLPTNAEVKNVLIYTSSPPYTFMAQWLIS
jgi:hypothetical protein